MTRRAYSDRRRAREVRARTISIKGTTKRELLIGATLYPETDYPKPRTRAECIDGPRPCPYVSCKYHLYLDVQPSGSIKLNFPDIEVEDMHESCALDIADRGGATLEGVGALLNVTRERIRQLELIAGAKLRQTGAELAGSYEAREPMDDEPRVRLPLYALPEEPGLPMELHEP